MIYESEFLPHTEEFDNMSTVIGALALCLVMAATAVAQAPADAIDYETARFDKNVVAVRITEEISLDGRLDNLVAWIIPKDALSSCFSTPGIT